MKRSVSRGWRVLAAGMAVGLGMTAGWSLPIITDAQIIEGADPVEQPPKFTGQTFDHPNEGAGFTVPFFGEDVPCFNDRNHEWNGASASLPLPGYLVGGEYVMFPNDDRDNDPYVVEITLSQPADVYLLIDNRHPDGVNTTPPNIENTMFWVTEGGWEPVRNGLNRRSNAEEPDEVGVDEGGDGVGPGVGLNQWSSVYGKRVPAGVLTLGTPENGGRNMYGLVVKPVPLRPFVSRAAGDLLGAVFEISDGETTRLRADSVRLSIDGTDVTGQVQISAQGGTTRVRYRLTEPFASLSEHTAVLRFTDDATPPVEIESELEFSVEYYATLTAADAVPAAAVATSASGFEARVVQGRDTAVWPGADLPNNTVRAELQLAGILRDPVTGGYLEDFAMAGSNPNGTHPVERINWNQELNDGGNLVEIGNFQSGSTPSFPDEPIPGIPGTDPDSGLNRDNIAGEIIGYLDLPAGLHRLGVNSDDGFRVTAGSDPRHPGNVVLGVFEGGRGSADTLFHVKVEAAGIYPVRLIWYEGGGGANLEFFSVHQPDPDGPGESIPVNTRSHAQGIRSYPRSAGTLPPSASVYPLGNSTGVPAGARIQAVLMPRGTTPSASGVQMTVNGAPATVTTSALGGNLLVEHVPDALWASGSTVNVSLTYADSGGQNTTVSWSFGVENHAGFAVIPASYAVPAGSVNTASSGFLVDMYQMDNFTGLPVARTGFADNNSTAAAEHQIARRFLDPTTDEPYSNYATPGENADGTHNIEIINWNQQYANAGDFNAGNGFEDAIIPGLLFDGDVAENNWIVAEAVTYLDLRKGRYRFGVNSDDGFKVSTSPNPRDAIHLTLGEFSGGRGAANTFFDFIVEQDGIYPFRLLWWEGTGGASVEFKSQHPVTLSQTLINDRERADGIRAYRTFTGTPVPRLVSYGPAGGATDVPPDQAIVVELENVGATTPQLWVNGAQVTAERTTSGTITTLRYAPPQPFPPSSTVQVRLVRGTAENTWAYTVGSSTVGAVTVALTQPTDGTRLPAGPATVALAATASAQGGEVVRVDFLDGAGNVIGSDTAAPYQFDWAGVLPGRYRVMARATDNRGFTGESAWVNFQVGEPIAINFQNYEVDAPPGYLPDFGEEFGDRGNGFLYGWDLDNTGGSRYRMSPLAPDTRYDTLNHLQRAQPSGTLWEIEVENGRYNVFMVGGDPGFFDSVFNLQAEGVTIVQGAATTDVRFIEGQGAVTVADGRLSIGNGPGAANNKIAFIEIYALPADSEQPSLGRPALAGGNVTFTWTGGGTLESAPAVNGPWTSTGNSTGSYTEPASEAGKYFRVRR